jgi:hypothetical protein
MSAFHQGAHAYHGKRNSRGQRSASKISKGVKPIPKEVWDRVERESRPLSGASRAASNKKPPVFSREYLIDLAARLRTDAQRATKSCHSNASH